MSDIQILAVAVSIAYGMLCARVIAPGFPSTRKFACPTPTLSKLSLFRFERGTMLARMIFIELWISDAPTRCTLCPPAA